MTAVAPGDRAGTAWLRTAQKRGGQHSMALPPCFSDPAATCCARHDECCCPTRRHAPRERNVSLRRLSSLMPGEVDRFRYVTQRLKY